MKKKILLVVILVPLVSIIVGMVVLTQQKIDKNEVAKEQIAKLPSFTFFTNDSSAFSANELVTKPTVIIHFHSECDFCHYEAKEITAQSELFQEAQVIFISEQPIAKIQEFVTKFELDKYDFINVLKAPQDGFYNTFGSGSVPNIFIYGADKKLLKHYKGETKVEAILKYLE